MSLLRSFVLMECAVSIVDTSSDHSTSTARWTRIRRTSRWPATASTISLHQNIASITSDTDPNGFRPSAATRTRMITSRHRYPDVRGPQQNRVASHARPSINEHPACSRLNGAAMVSSVYARKPTTVSVKPINPPRKASSNVATTLTRTRSSQC